jgi:hypothetical protein
LPGAWLNQAILEEVMQHHERLFGLRTLPPVEAKPTSRAAREREAKRYWDSLTPEQEAWALQKMQFAEMGEVARTTV